MIKITLSIMLLNLFFLSVNARGLEKDTATIISDAKRDAKSFNFDKANKKAILHNLNNPNSDYFKPTPNTSKLVYLNDSLYVRTFKVYAIKHLRARRTTKTLLFIGGGLVIFLGLVVAAAVSAGPGLTN